MDKVLTGDYGEKGEYHRHLDKKWTYLPVYLTKMEKIDRLLAGKQGLKILDAGCGEGILVEKYKKQGHDITGLDYNYSSESIRQGDITAMPFENDSFDLILCLDVLEHIDILSHEKALNEFQRVLKKKGQLILTLPNLAHFASRIAFLFCGKLIRTAQMERHPSDRPYREYKKIIKKYFDIKAEAGLFPTFPLICVLTYLAPSKVVWLHRIYNSLFGWMAGFCFLNLTVAQVKK